MKSRSVLCQVWVPLFDMQNISRHLQDLIEQESRLPEINAHACVYSYYDQSDCHACVDACPSQAWVLDDQCLGLDTEACDGCGLCVPACPCGALAVHFPYTIRQFAGSMIALFACKHSGIKQHSEQLSCINVLGLRQLLLLYNSGIKHLLIAQAECTDCQYHQPDNLYQRLQQLNRFLRERNKPDMKVLYRSAGKWEKIYNTDEVISRGTQLSRRQFLHGDSQTIRQNLMIMDPLNLAESQTVAPGELLPTITKQKVHWPWLPELDATLCNGCDACFNLCPTQALQPSRNEENLMVEYRINPRSCNGCGICTSVCESEAITVQSNTLSSAHSIDLDQQICTACGNNFHLPRRTRLESGKKLCRICAANNHNTNLFQVMDEHQC